jgi:hypothetical protein
MVQSKTVLASVAAFGLAFGNPAFAQSTRSGDAIPSVSVAQLTRAAAPITKANDANPRQSLLLALFGVIGAAGLLVAASSGGGRNDSPG